VPVRLGQDEQRRWSSGNEISGCWGIAEAAGANSATRGLTHPDMASRITGFGATFPG
jgi:hypothetical protein